MKNLIIIFLFITFCGPASAETSSDRFPSQWLGCKKDSDCVLVKTQNGCEESINRKFRKKYNKLDLSKSLLLCKALMGGNHHIAVCQDSHECGLKAVKDDPKE